MLSRQSMTLTLCERAPVEPFRRRPRFRRRLGQKKNILELESKVPLTKRAEAKVRNLLSSAYADIQTLDSNRRSTLQFAAALALLSFVLGFAMRRIGSGRRGPVMVTRMDRSMGGKEVVVAIAEADMNRPTPTPTAHSPLAKSKSKSKSNRLPRWWPPSPSPPLILGADTHLYQRAADSLIAAIIHNRTHGQDATEDDIIQLRRICRISGIRISFGTENTRDSLFRTSVDYILNKCCSAPSNSSFIEIDGEDARQFIAGLAENIGLENLRAARIVSGAVAARTRSRFLQAWAMEMQGQHSGMMAELSKICHILRIFPPEKSSAEMEMVASGLEKHLKVEQRQYLMDVFAGISDEETRKVAAEALGLAYFPNRLGTQ